MLVGHRAVSGFLLGILLVVLVGEERRGVSRERGNREFNRRCYLVLLLAAVRDAVLVAVHIAVSAGGVSDAVLVSVLVAVLVAAAVIEADIVAVVVAIAVVAKADTCITATTARAATQTVATQTSRLTHA
jgi:hypothetical protein